MSLRADADEVIARLARAPEPPLIAIDGLPCSGKSTLAERLQHAHGFDCISLDDFVRPEADSPAWRVPTFPFEYIRYAEFVAAVETLAARGECDYAPFDWETLAISGARRRVTLATPVMIEGVSSLYPALCPLYGLKIFVDSDRATILEEVARRGAGPWPGAWRTLFVPSADIYMQTGPELRADIIVRGRSAR